MKQEKDSSPLSEAMVCEHVRLLLVHMCKQGYERVSVIKNGKEKYVEMYMGIFVNTNI